MFKYYLKIAFRSIGRTKGFSAISILGLSIGIACAFIVYLYADFELNYDKQVKDYQQIYRINTDDYTFGAEPFKLAECPLGLIPILKNKYPQIDLVCYFTNGAFYKVAYNNEFINNDKIIKADPNFFKMFPAKFLLGDDAALYQPNTCVITKKIADTYFANKNPLGEILLHGEVKYTVSGVIESMPNNSHLNFDFILSFEPYSYDLSVWYAFAHTYVKFKPNADIDAFSNEIKGIYEREMGSRFKQNQNKFIFVQALTDIHFHSDRSNELTESGNIHQLYLYSIVGMLILLIACINYMNLTTAIYVNRAREIGVRKTVGASKAKLIIQFLFESLIFTFIAHIFAIFLVELSLPYLNTLLQMNLRIDYSNVRIGFSIVSLIVITTIISGSYPAFLLSSYKPSQIFKGSVRAGTSTGITRRILVVFQFTISLVLVVAVLVIYSQMLFMKNYKLGFDKDHKLIIEFPYGVVNFDSRQFVKNQFNNKPVIKSCSFTDVVPGNDSDRNLFLPGEAYNTTFPGSGYNIDEDYCSLFDLEFIAGRNFQSSDGKRPPDNGVIVDKRFKLILNETAIKILELGTPEKALKKKIYNNGTEIIGIVKDYHFKGLHEKIEPLVFYYINDSYKYLILDLNSTDLQKSIREIEIEFNNLFPNVPFNYFFLDQDFNKQYKSEEQMGELFAGLSGLGIVIACLGLFGLSAFMAQKKMKEIGIRKVYGASNASIILLLSKEFSKGVLLANIIAWPVAYYFLSGWLNNFAYHIKLSIWPFVLAGLITLIIANLTTLFQALKAAKANPVDALKYE